MKKKKFEYGDTSLANLMRLHPDLETLAIHTLEISPYDIGILKSDRTDEEQHEKVLAGLSQTEDSLHEIQPDGYSHALDFTVYNENGQEVFQLYAAKLITEAQMLGYFRKVVQAFMTTAIKYGIQIEVGILWKDFVDGPHIQLNQKFYGRK